MTDRAEFAGLLLAGTLLFLDLGCGAGMHRSLVPPAAPLEAEKQTMDQAVSQVACSVRVVESTPAKVRLVATVENRGTMPVHLLRTKRMPYVMVMTPDRVRVSWSIQPKAPLVSYSFIEIPVTVELAPGARLDETAEFALPPLVADHFRGPHAYEGTLAAAFSVEAEFGSVPFRIDSAAAYGQGYASLVAAQSLCLSAAVRVPQP
jgi:hypothetical protein